MNSSELLGIIMEKVQEVTYHNRLDKEDRFARALFLVSRELAVYAKKEMKWDPKKELWIKDCPNEALIVLQKAANMVSHD